MSMFNMFVAVMLAAASLAVPVAAFGVARADVVVRAAGA